MRKKLKDTGGLTMVELLCATAILVLLCLMMNTCLGMAVKSYQAITAESEAQLLLSSLSDALADKLRYCVVTVEADGSLKEASVGGTITKADGTVQGIAITNDKLTVDGRDLLPNGAYGTSSAGGYIGRYTVESKDDTGNDVLPVTYDRGTNSFAVKFAVKDEQLNITRKADFTVRCLNPVKKEE